MPLGAPASAPETDLLDGTVASFRDLPGWADDDHAAALAAFRGSARRILTETPSRFSVQPSDALFEVARRALALEADGITKPNARAFFEQHFTPVRLKHTGPQGLLTGYYEPVLEGRRAPDATFNIPVYRRPADLENLVAESERGAMAHALTHARRTANGLEPYATREDIEQGALAGLGLELVYLSDPVDCFFMHVQGSGCIRFADGTEARITYDGKNGHPYTSIGRYLIDQGLMTADAMSLDALKAWLSENPVSARAVLWQNKSFVFFRELSGEEAKSPLGALHIPLCDGRSLAVDTAYHALGTPIYVAAPTLTHAGDPAGFARLMIAHDVGSAIRGPERGDIYFGSGKEAGARAGITKHAGQFIVLRATLP